MAVDPAIIAGSLSAAGSVISMLGKLIDTPDPAVVLADMRAELAKMQAALGPGGAVERALAVSNTELDAAIEAERKRQLGNTDTSQP
jgi:hypothetical protein